MNTRRQVICRVKRKIRIERNIAISVENKFNEVNLFGEIIMRMYIERLGRIDANSNQKLESK